MKGRTNLKPMWIMCTSSACQREIQSQMWYGGRLEENLSTGIAANVIMLIFCYSDSYNISIGETVYSIIPFSALLQFGSRFGVHTCSKR